MCIRVVNLKVPKFTNDVDVTDIRCDLEYNLTYRVLNLIASNNGITRSQIKKQVPMAWRILKRAIKKDWIIREREYFITENGLDKIDCMKIDYGVYEG